MVRFLICIFFLFIALTDYAQLSVNKGEWTKHKLGTIHLGFLATDSNSIYAIDDRNFSSPVINVFDKETLLFKTDISLKPVQTKDESERLTHVFSLQGGLFSVIEKTTKEDQILIFVEQIGQKDQRVCLDTLPKKSIKGEYEIIANEQQSAFVFINQRPINNSNRQRINLTTYNTSLQQIWHHSLEFKDNEKQFILSNWKLFNDHQVTFIGRPIIDLYKPQSEFVSGNQNSYYLFNFNQNTTVLREIEIKLHQKLINEIDFIQTDSSCIVSGVFSVSNELHSDGIFTLLFDDNFLRRTHQIHHFTKEELSDFSSFQKGNKGRRSSVQKNYISELLVRNFLVLENGEYVMLAEEFGKEWEDPLNTARQESLKSTSYIYYYQNIHVFWYNADGSIKSIRTIAKNQMARDATNAYNSFSAAVNKDEIIILYNENPKNIDNTSTENKTTSSDKKMFIRSAQLKSKGAISISSLTLPSKKERVSINLGAQLLDGNVYFLCRKRWSKKAVYQVKLAETAP